MVDMLKQFSLERVQRPIVAQRRSRSRRKPDQRDSHLQLTLCEGNLLDDTAEVLVNTVNATGPTGPTMGNGIAKAFALRWPAIVPPYKAACQAGELRGGVCRLFNLPEPVDLFSHSGNRKWAAFCTKHDWRNLSEYRWIASGLSDLVRLMQEGSHTSVAVPALGCDKGGLAWARVRPMILDVFKDADIELRLYSPLRR
jgi:O-acetyl-ADP-ribose deacetylase (regulator of RNase III)